MLFLVMILVRLAFILLTSIPLLFSNLVMLRRIYELNRIPLGMINLVRQHYNAHPVADTFALMAICMFTLILGLAEFELKIYNIQSITEAFYYCVVTMTTVGFGDISSLSYSGKWLMVIATFLGVIFEGMLLVAWSKATEFTRAEAAAFKMLKLDHLKRQMKEAAASKFKIIWKLRKLANNEGV